MFKLLTLFHIQQICRRRLEGIVTKTWKISIKDSLIVNEVENIVAKGEITHHVLKSGLLLLHQKASVCGKGLTHEDAFWLIWSTLPHCLELCSRIELPFIEIFHTYDRIVVKSSATDLLYMVKISSTCFTSNTFNPFLHIDGFLKT